MGIAERFIQLRKQYIESQFGGLNPEQLKAAMSINGAALVLAGAGSGKTTVIINRIMNLLRFGDAYESEVIWPEPTQDDIEELERLIKDGGRPSGDLAVKLRTGNIRPWNILIKQPLSLRRGSFPPWVRTGTTFLRPLFTQPV